MPHKKPQTFNPPQRKVPDQIKPRGMQYPAPQPLVSYHGCTVITTSATGSPSSKKGGTHGFVASVEMDQVKSSMFLHAWNVIMLDMENSNLRLVKHNHWIATVSLSSWPVSWPLSRREKGMQYEYWSMNVSRWCICSIGNRVSNTRRYRHARSQLAWTTSGSEIKTSFLIPFFAQRSSPFQSDDKVGQYTLRSTPLH